MGGLSIFILHSYQDPNMAFLVLYNTEVLFDFKSFFINSYYKYCQERDLESGDTQESYLIMRNSFQRLRLFISLGFNIYLRVLSNLNKTKHFTYPGTVKT